ncbi:putative transcription factor C2H2 family [Helianthus anomalus]
MGSSTSKSIDPEPSLGRRSYSRNVFQASCIQPTPGSSDDEQVSDNEAKQNDTECNMSNMNSSKSKGKLYRNKKVKRAEKQPHVPPDAHFSEWGESSVSGTSRNESGSSHNPSSNFLSRFNLFPGNISSRSSRAYPESSTSSIVSNDDHPHSRHYSKKTRIRHGCEIFPSCFMPMSPGPRDDDSNSNSDSGSGSGSGSGSDNSDASSIHELGPNGNDDNGTESNGNMYYDYPRNGSWYGRHRRTESREYVEQNVRFSRTLSVGRLRDRVLHRPTLPELQREAVNDVDIHDTGPRLSNENVMISTTSSSYSSTTVTNSLYGNREFEVENTGARETSYSNLVEHRENYHERRRRIRSQVHALQRLEGRFTNLGHERSCILSGRYRTGHCACPLNNQDLNDGTNDRGSISRIVLLTEALFEVLDEIRQQPVVSSSRPVLSSIGSGPTPTEVVEALPVKLYRKLSKHVNEDDAQCYICLVEYDDGDEVRVLPCHHEFHRLCIDKWLKEIHRICPLCRGDVCKAGSLPDESSQL